MTRLILRSLLIGFIIGTIFLGIAPMGLGSVFVARLRPVLVPGRYLFPRSLVNTLGSLWWVPLIILNGLVYTVFVFVILFAYRMVVGRKAVTGQKE